MQESFAKFTTFTEHREDWLGRMLGTCIHKVRGSNLFQDIGRSSFALDKRWASTLKQATLKQACFIGAAGAAPIKHARTGTFVHMLGDFSVYSRA
jgi:hypothetical protein